MTVLRLFLIFLSKPEAIKKKIKKYLIIISVLLLLILIFLIGIRYYVNNNKKEIIAIIENVINENRKGKIIFDAININSHKDLSSIEIQILNLSLLDSLYSQHHRKTAFFQEVNATISLVDILNNKIKIKSVSVKKGQLNIFVDEDHYTNTYVFGANTVNDDSESDLKIIGNDVDVFIEDIDFEKLVIPRLEIDIFMKEMGFNLDKGTFFNNVRCVGSMQPIIDTDKKTIEIPNFQMSIGDQKFEISSFINTKENKYKFHLSIKEANYNKTIRLLSGNIESKLANFSLSKPFEAKAEISGIFKYRSKPKIEIEYSIQNNEIIYHEDSIYLKNVSLNGTFKNSIYQGDSIKTENRKNFTNILNDFNGFYKNIPFQINNLTLINEFSKPKFLRVDYKLEGKVKFLNDIISSGDYKFANGKFFINGTFNNYFNSLSEIFKLSKINMESSNLIVKSRHNSNQFNIPHLALEMNINNAEIKELIVKMNTNESLRINGIIKNFSTLFLDEDYNKPVISTLNISSDYINFNSLLQSFGAHKKQTQSKNLKDVKHSINTLAKKFNPNLNFSVQKLDFSDTQFKNIKLIAHYQKNRLNIQEISGNYKDGKAKATLDIELSPRKDSNNEETLYLNLLLNVNGKIEHWAEILQSENFFFKHANYNLIVNFSNEAKALKDLVEKSKIEFHVQEGSMLYKPTGLTLPFKNISLSMQNKNAYLKDFELKLPNNQTVHLKGQLDNFIDLFNNTDATKNVKSSITISSKNIEFSNFVNAFNPNHKKNSQQNNVKIILKDLYAKFNPTVSLKIDNLSYKNVSLEKVNANLNFKGLSTLSFNNVYFYYFNKKVTLEAQFNLNHPTQTNFNTNLSLDDIAIENMLKTFNNFGYTQLNPPTEITGVVNANAFFKGVIDDTNGVLYNTIEADLDYNIKQLRVKNFKPLIEAANLIFRKERFEDVRFVNINSSLNVKNNIINLPQTNVQSTAFDFFIEGDIENSIHTDLWISIPLSNIKRRDLTKIPNKKTFDDTNKKIYLEIKSDKNGKLHNKLQLNNKKHLRTTN
ncbi:MAG: hypothetical protein L3J34_08355 [Flavobacteriaceae bacterium]|nr:hypothetical protein [Flavobacteriaceae bacterium]